MIALVLAVLAVSFSIMAHDVDAHAPVAFFVYWLSWLTCVLAVVGIGVIALVLA